MEVVRVGRKGGREALGSFKAAFQGNLDCFTGLLRPCDQEPRLPLNRGCAANQSPLLSSRSEEETTRKRRRGRRKEKWDAVAAGRERKRGREREKRAEWDDGRERNR